MIFRTIGKIPNCISPKTTYGNIPWKFQELGKKQTKKQTDIHCLKEEFRRLRFIKHRTFKIIHFQGISDAKKILVETLQQPEIQRIERKREEGEAGAAQLLPWELIAGAGIGSTISMILILTAVCTYRRRQIDSSTSLLAQEESSQDGTAAGFKDFKLGLKKKGCDGKGGVGGSTVDESSPDLIPRGEPCGSGKT